MVIKGRTERMRPEDYAPGESPIRSRATYVRKEIVSKGVGFGSAQDHARLATRLLHHQDRGGGGVRARLHASSG